MSPRARPLLLFVLLLLLFPALGAGIRWVNDAQAELAWWEWALLGSLPVLLGLYLRYFSILACRGHCRPPEG